MTSVGQSSSCQTEHCRTVISSPEKPAVAHCHECNERMCAECLSAHNRVSVTRGHIVVMFFDGTQRVMTLTTAVTTTSTTSASSISATVEEVASAATCVSSPPSTPSTSTTSAPTTSSSTAIPNIASNNVVIRRVMMPKADGSSKAPFTIQDDKPSTSFGRPWSTVANFPFGSRPIKATTVRSVIGIDNPSTTWQQLSSGTPKLLHKPKSNALPPPSSFWKNIRRDHERERPPPPLIPRPQQQHLPLNQDHLTQKQSGPRPYRCLRVYEEDVEPNLVDSCAVDSVLTPTPSGKQYAKPIYSIDHLIVLCLRNGPSDGLRVDEIFAFICENFPHYRTAFDWRHRLLKELSTNLHCFEKRNQIVNGHSHNKWRIRQSSVMFIKRHFSRQWTPDEKANILASLLNPDDFESLESGTKCTPSKEIPPPIGIRPSTSELGQLADDIKPGSSTTRDDDVPIMTADQVVAARHAAPFTISYESTAICRNEQMDYSFGVGFSLTPTQPGKMYSKPVYFNSTLIALSLRNATPSGLPVKAIYTFICENFPYYRTMTTHWRCCVRHRLMQRPFIRFGKVLVGRSRRFSYLWSIDPNAKCLPQLAEDCMDSAEKEACMLNPDDFDAIVNGTKGMPLATVNIRESDTVSCSVVDTRAYSVDSPPSSSSASFTIHYEHDYARPTTSSCRDITSAPFAISEDVMPSSSVNSTDQSTSIDLAPSQSLPPPFSIQDEHVSTTTQNPQDTTSIASSPNEMINDYFTVASREGELEVVKRIVESIKAKTEKIKIDTDEVSSLALSVMDEENDSESRMLTTGDLKLGESSAASIEQHAEETIVPTVKTIPPKSQKRHYPSELKLEDDFGEIKVVCKMLSPKKKRSRTKNRSSTSGPSTSTTLVTVVPYQCTICKYIASSDEDFTQHTYAVHTANQMRRLMSNKFHV